MPGTWRASRGKGACGRSRSTANHGGDATGQGLFNLLRGDEVNVCVYGACRDNHAFTTDDLGAGSNDDVNAGLRVWVACFANGCNASIFQTNVRFHNAPMVHNQCVGHDGIDGPSRLRTCLQSGVSCPL